MWACTYRLLGALCCSCFAWLLDCWAGAASRMFTSACSLAGQANVAYSSVSKHLCRSHSGLQQYATTVGTAPRPHKQHTVCFSSISYTNFQGTCQAHCRTRVLPARTAHSQHLIPSQEGFFRVIQEGLGQRKWPRRIL